uniref:Protein SSXT n=1 Tax=Parasteatoda tepidariorum TaxID=114398 RepID=A0A2L2YF27_PARTP|nr:SS18-like protein 2 [Parasteatoda tepidariorum]
MSLLFTGSPKVHSIPRHVLVQKMLEENNFLIKIIKYYQNRGRAIEVHQLLQVLHRNMILLGSIADEIYNISSNDAPNSTTSSDEQTSGTQDTGSSDDQQVQSNT